jgi:hypothetical protein
MPHLVILYSGNLDARTKRVTLANGMKVRELIVDVNEGLKRIAYASVGERFTHHNASIQVFADGESSRIVWITELLPKERIDSDIRNGKEGAGVR